MLRKRADEQAAWLTREQGKPLRESVRELKVAADMLDWAAEEARRVYGRVIPARGSGPRFVVEREPVGPVAAFSPWNFPATQPMRKLAAALAVGCSVILKPAEETPATALALADALEEADLPPGRAVHRVRRPRDDFAPSHRQQRRAQGVVHRFDPGRSADRRPRRAGTQALHAGTGRTCPRPRADRCRRAARCRTACGGQIPQRGTDLHLAEPDPGSRRGVRRVPRGIRIAGVQIAGRAVVSTRQRTWVRLRIHEGSPPRRR